MTNILLSHIIISLVFSLFQVLTALNIGSNGIGVSGVQHLVDALQINSVILIQYSYISYIVINSFLCRLFNL